VPDVSVLLPARNAQATLEVALQSVLRTRDVDFEVVLLDHRSDDDTRVIAEGIAVADKRVRVVRVDDDVKLGGLLEKGRHFCQAPLIARFDADDVMHPHRLREDVRALDDDGDLSVISCRSKLVPYGLASPGFEKYVAWQNAQLSVVDHAREMWVEQPVCHPAATFRASALDDVGGYRDGVFPEDYDLFLRLTVAGHHMRKRPVVHHGWREHPQKATWTDPRYARDTFAMLKAQALVATYSVDKRPVIVAGAGKEGGRIGRFLLAEGVQPTAYVDVSDKRIGRIRHGCPVHPVDELKSLKEQWPNAFFIGAVGTAGLRPEVRAQLTAAGFVEGVDAVVVA